MSLCCLSMSVVKINCHHLCRAMAYPVQYSCLENYMDRAAWWARHNWATFRHMHSYETLESPSGIKRRAHLLTHKSWAHALNLIKILSSGKDAHTVQSCGGLMLRHWAQFSRRSLAVPASLPREPAASNGSARCGAITEHCLRFLPFLVQVKILFGFLLWK